MKPLQISALALGVSVIGTLGNLYYTRKKFRQSVEGVVSLTIIGLVSGGIRTRIKNLRTDKTIRDVKAETWFRLRRSGIVKLRRRWLSLHTATLTDIEPLKKRQLDTCAFLTDSSSLARAIHEHYPEYMRAKFEEAGKGLSTIREFFVSSEHSSQVWEVRHRVSFRSAISGSPLQKIEFRAVAEPKVDHTNAEGLLLGMWGWEGLETDGG